MAVPMRQYSVSKQVQDHFKVVYEELYKKLLNASHFGLPFDPIPRSMSADDESVRETTFENLWELGGFGFTRASLPTRQQPVVFSHLASVSVSNYQDIFVSKESNEAVYAFWRRKVGERIKDPEKRALLAPEVAPHFFGGKRPSLEQSYYEVFNQDHVDIVNTKATPILEIYENGVKTADKAHEFDVLIFATGARG